MYKYLHYTISILLITYILFSCTRASQITAAQKAEIAKLREELDAAFKEHERIQEMADQQGIIVQPEWTQENQDKPIDKINAKVVVTNEGLSEAAQLRTEINKAVAEDVYAPGIAANKAGHTATVKQLEDELRKHGSTRDIPLVNSTQQIESEQLGSALDMENSTIKAPNIVEASTAFEQIIDISRLERLELSKRRTREMLVLKRIVEDFSFDLGADVQQWQHIVHNSSAYFVGRRSGDLLLVQKQKTTSSYIPSHTLPVTQAIGYMTCFQFWNSGHEIQEGIILLALANEVHWYRFNDQQRQFKNDWQWHVGTIVTGLTHFQLDERHYLAISTNQSMRTGYYALNIYAYDLNVKEFWIVQRMQLRNPCTEITVLDTGRDVLLAVAQENMAEIYTYNPSETNNADYIHFQLKHSISSKAITHIAGFQMGGRNYLALGGLQPQILQYEQGNLKPKTILSHNFGLVELFFPIPVRTYRDDLLLLVQHRVDFGTHTLTVLETLIWNGEAFEASIPVPCELGAHTMYGASCMLDIERNEGLMGAALLRQGDALLIIVPRQRAESGLFQLHTELLSKNSELLDLQEIWSLLKDWVHEHDVLISNAQAFLNMNTSIYEYHKITTPELIYDGDFENLYINDHKWTAEDSEADIKQLLAEIRAVEQEMERYKRDIDLFNFSYETLDFDEIELDELFVENVNDEPFYVQNGSLIFDGTLNLHDLNVLEQVDTVEKLEAYMPELKIDGDIEFDYINDIPWSEIEEKLIFRNKPIQLDKLHVDGEVIMEGKLQIEKLDDLNFPDDYLWSQSPTTTVVRGEKIFTGTLSVNVVDTDGLINGVNPMDAITLSDDQDWIGTPTFTKLEVAEILELNGTAHGRSFEEAPSNPTLLENTNINADCYFDELIIDGPIFIDGLFDNVSIGALLADVVQRPDDPAEEIIIPSSKQFNNIEMPVDFHLESAAINDIPIEYFIPSHTEQILENLTYIKGYVYFHNLELSGAFAGVHIEEMLANALRIDEPLDARDIEMHFIDDINVSGEVHILNQLNGIPLTEYQTIHEDLYVDEASFEHLYAKEAYLQKGINGTALFNGYNLSEFLSEHNCQTSYGSGNIYIDELILPHGLEADELHGINATLLLDLLQRIDELPLMILAGEVQVENIIINGSVQVDQLNGEDFDEEVQRSAIWLNRPNYVNTSLTFMDDVEIAQGLNVLGTLNGRNMTEFVNNIVFRGNGNETLRIIGPKKFLCDVHVLGNTQVQALNGIPFQQIATKKHLNEFHGDLIIGGNLYVNDIIVNKQFNNNSMPILMEKFRYDKELQAIVLRGKTKLPGQLHLEDLTILGHFGEMDIPLPAFFNDLIYKNQTYCRITGAKTFTGRVTIKNGVYIHRLNDLNVPELFDNIIYIDEPLPVQVHTPVIFNAPVYMQSAKINRVLRTPRLDGCDLSEWLRESVRVDQPMVFKNKLRFAPGALDNNQFVGVKTVNGINMSTVLTLHTPQNFSEPLILDELYLSETASIVALDTVNNVNLSEEYANTLLTTGNQVVSTPLIIKSIHVTGDLHVNTLANGDKNLSDVATLDTPILELETPLYFKRLVVDDLYTNHTISGIDFVEWYNKSVWKTGRPVQLITGNWSIRNLWVEGNITYENKDRLSRQDIQITEQDFEHAYADMCDNLLAALAQKRAYYIQYLELQHVLNVSLIIQHIIHLQPEITLQYLLINGNSSMQIYKWNLEKQHFTYLNELQNSSISKMQSNEAIVKNNTLHYAVSFADNVAHKTWRIFDVHNNLTINFNSNNNSDDNNNNTDWKQAPNDASQTVIWPTLRKTRAIKYLPRPTIEARLKPHIPYKHNFTFNDFREIVILILMDLNNRLHTEMNITQLSIPESDLFDEHLIDDFNAIMFELKTQRLYDNDTFAHIHSNKLKLPSNPAQVLAVRTVQILWPVIVEIEDIHNYLRANETHEHPLCTHIKYSLGYAARDVLQLANERNKSNDTTVTLNAVIERIRLLQQDINNMCNKLAGLASTAADTVAVADIDADIITIADAEQSIFKMLTPAKKRTPKTKIQQTHALRLLVSFEWQPRELYAYIELREDTSVAPALDYIHLYDAQGKHYQTLLVSRPRLLVALRIRDDTLLAFVQHCCEVHVYIYRGIEGFTKFANFNLATDIKQLLVFKLPKSNGGILWYALGVAEAQRITFYEVVIAGRPEVLEGYICT